MKYSWKIILIIISLYTLETYASNHNDALDKFRFDFRQETECSICMEEYTGQTLVISRCLHVMCNGCYKKLPVKTCPFCRAEYNPALHIDFNVLSGHQSFLLWPLVFNDQEKMLQILSQLQELVKNKQLEESALQDMLNAMADKKTLLEHAQHKRWRKLETVLNPKPELQQRIDNKLGNLLTNKWASEPYKKKIWECHWFPLQETSPSGDPINNLFAKNGPLDKLDRLNNKNARQYEFAHNRKALGGNFSGAGHCHEAAIVSCILPPPKHSVSMQKIDGTMVNFTRHDIQGLLVKCVNALVYKVDYKGQRFRSPHDDFDAPSPPLYLQGIKNWSDDGLPFAIDIEQGENTWTFPFDQVSINESEQGPENYNAPRGAKSHQIKIQSTAYPSKTRTYKYWHTDNGDSGWITPPSFAWCPLPRGDLMNRATWQWRHRPSNPEVDPQLVYDIYMKSLD